MLPEAQPPCTHGCSPQTSRLATHPQSLPADSIPPFPTGFSLTSSPVPQGDPGRPGFSYPGPRGAPVSPGAGQGLPGQGGHCREDPEGQGEEWGVTHWAQRQTPGTSPTHYVWLHTCADRDHCDGREGLQKISDSPGEAASHPGVGTQSGRVSPLGSVPSPQPVVAFQGDKGEPGPRGPEVRMGLLRTLSGAVHTPCYRGQTPHPGLSAAWWKGLHTGLFQSENCSWPGMPGGATV